MCTTNQSPGLAHSSRRNASSGSSSDSSALGVLVGGLVGLVAASSALVVGVLGLGGLDRRRLVGDVLVGGVLGGSSSATSVAQGQVVGGLGGRLVGHLGGRRLVGVVVDSAVDRLGLLDGVGRRDLELLGLVLLGHVLLHHWWFGSGRGKVGAATAGAALLGAAAGEDLEDELAEAEVEHRHDAPS